ncbi:hypothetical protein [Nitrosomonas cryotolerans]|uniref:hypothetical protein n=1 Tax=Nitrosomonas cryotolerans TaxID=44575 RepID=UPI000A41F5D0|nr:hypothetical protein [Nitrosomonas cryotolerans]
MDDQGRLLGEINAVILLKITDERLLTQPVTSLLSKSSVILSTNMSVLDAYSCLQNFVGISIPVIANETSRQFVGVLYENKLTSAYLQAVEQSRQERS